MSKKLALVFSLAMLLTTTTTFAREATTPGLLREKVIEKKEQILEKRETVREKVQTFKNTRTSLKQVTLNAISTNTLTVADDTSGQLYTINILPNTQLRRRFWGKLFYLNFHSKIFLISKANGQMIKKPLSMLL